MISVDNKCIGCGACKDKCPIDCISIIQKDGQYIPVVEKERCVNCKQCEDVCVAKHASKVNCHKTRKTYYGYANTKHKRIASSSGGIFYSIAEKFILDGGKVIGAAYDEFFNVHHIVVDNLEDLSLIRGSKYVESNLQSMFKETEKMLNSGEKVLFSGLPCQIGAIKLYLGEEYENLFCCEVFCHGAPRSGIFAAYINELKRKYGLVLGFNFRSKHYGWNEPTYEIHTKNKKIIQKQKNNIYHLMFGNHVSLRDSCYECQFRKYERAADISLGDFWGIENYYSNVETKQGVSAIIVNTEKGNALLENQDIYIKPCKLSEIYDKNTWMIQNYEKQENQKSFISDFNIMSNRSFFRKYTLKYKVIDRITGLIRRVL